MAGEILSLARGMPINRMSLGFTLRSRWTAGLDRLIVDPRQTRLLLANTRILDRWMAKSDLSLLALMSIVAIGLSWELATALPAAGAVPPRLAMLLAVQVAAIALTLFVCARRGQDHARLADQLQYRRRLSQVQKDCAAMALPDRDDLCASLREIAPSVGAERLIVFERHRSGDLEVWCDSQAESPLDPRLGGAAGEASAAQAVDRALVRLPGVLLLPLRVSEVTLGVLTLSGRQIDEAWTSEQGRRAEALADTLAHALLHLQDRRDVRETADFSRAVLASISGDVAVLDANGTVLATNRSWAGRVGSSNPTIKAEPGMSLLAPVTLTEESRRSAERRVARRARGRPADGDPRLRLGRRRGASLVRDQRSNG